MTTSVPSSEAEIGARVRGRMQELLPAMDHAELAGRISIRTDELSRSLDGERPFTAIELVDLAYELQTSAHWFITGEPDPFAVKYAVRGLSSRSADLPKER